MHWSDADVRIGRILQLLPDVFQSSFQCASPPLQPLHPPALDLVSEHGASEERDQDEDSDSPAGEDGSHPHAHYPRIS